MSENAQVVVGALCISGLAPAVVIWVLWELLGEELLAALGVAALVAAAAAALWFLWPSADDLREAIGL